MRITRRAFLKLLAEGAAALGLLKIVSLFPSPPRTVLVRPPGAVEENLFNTLCVRCGICVEVCPTNTIALAGFEDGLEAANTPKIDPLPGPCEFYRGRCEEEMKCSKLCPTRALQIVDKEEVKIGTVELYEDLCLAYQGKECVVCDEMCPIRDAITLDREVKPHFHGQKCVGCGTCVHYCPAEPKALALRSTGARRVNV